MFSLPPGLLLIGTMLGAFALYYAVRWYSVYFRALSYKNDLNTGLAGLFEHAQLACSRDRYQYSFFNTSQSIAGWALGRNVITGEYGEQVVRLTWFQSKDRVQANIEIPTCDLGELELTTQNLPEQIEDLLPSISGQVLKLLSHGGVRKISFQDKTLCIELRGFDRAYFGGRSSSQWYEPVPKVIESLQWTLEDISKLCCGLPHEPSE